MHVGLVHYLILGTLLFAIGFFGVLTKKNLISILMGIELMLNGVNINLAAANSFNIPNEAAGQVWVMLIMAVAAAEIAIGLALVMAVYRRKGEVELNKFDLLKW